MNGEPFKADLAYSEIYQQAKKKLFIVDNYIGIKTLEHLINCNNGVDVTIFSDNLHNGLRANIFADFCKEYSKINILIKRTGGIYHDRFIVLDYGTDDERIFMCGASSKDAGARVTTIIVRHLELTVAPSGVSLNNQLRRPTVTGRILFSVKLLLKLQ